MNDNAPMFSNKHFEINVYENASIGDKLFQFKVSDKDEGLNSEVSYFLSGNESKFFAIDDEGWLKLSHVIDYELCRKYDFNIIAFDRGKPQMETEVLVHTYIIDINDNVPRVHVVKGHQISISENNNVNGLITQLLVTDLDSGEVNGNISINLVSHTDKFQIIKYDGLPLGDNINLPLEFNKGLSSAQTYFLRAAVIFDRELTANYTLTIVCCDQKFISKTYIYIEILDKNDNYPTFSAESYAISLSSNSPIGSFVTLIVATDKDVGKNGLVTYNIIPSNYSSLFNISHDNGVLVTSNYLDGHIFHENFSLIISASDCGTNPLKSYINVAIFITGWINKCIPSFKKHSYFIPIDLAANTGFIVCHLEAYCTGHKDKLFYYIEGNGNIFFKIDDNGTLSLRTKLKTNNIQLKIFALNIGNPFHPAFTKVTVSVTNNTVQHVALYEDQVRVVDLSHLISFVRPVTRANIQCDSNRSIIYKITSGNDNRFALNYSSGDLYYFGDRVSRTCFNLSISAICLPDFIDSIQILIFIGNYFHVSPISFCRSHYSFHIAENSPIGSVVGQVITHISNKNIEQKVKYYIESGNEMRYFIINEHGYILTAAYIDREKIKSFDLIILASLNCFKDKTRVIITIIDVNDNTPVFISERVIYVSETLEILDVVYSSVVVDPDSSSNSLLTYELLDDALGHFCICPRTGYIYLLKPLTSPFYMIVISVHDNGTPQLESSMYLNIAVKETKNNAPVFMSHDFVIILEGNRQIYSPFYTIMGEDSDFGANGVISYSVLSHSTIIDMYANGMIFLKSNVNLTTCLHSVHKISICAQDNGEPKLQANATIFLHFEYDFNSTLFTNNTYYFHVYDNIDVNKAIGNISLYQPNVSLILSPKNDYFTIVGNEVRTKSIFKQTDIFHTYGNNIVVSDIYGFFGNEISQSKIVIQVLNISVSPRYISNKICVLFDADVFDVKKVLVDATDKRIRYTITAGNVKGMFSIDSLNGKLYWNQSNMDECADKYKLTILAYDENNTEFNDTIELDANVKLANGKCLFYRVENITINIYENETLGNIVYKINIIQKKLSILMKYYIREGNTDSYFLIHPNQGTLQLVKHLDYETVTNYNLEIVATDGTATAVFYIFIAVLDCNDNKPFFESYFDKWHIDDNALTGQIIGNCSVIDLDANSAIQYTLLTIDTRMMSYIILDKESCVVRLKQSLNNVMFSEITFNISACDGKYSTSKRIKVSIRNTKPPVVISPTSVIIDSNIQPNHRKHIYQVISEKWNDEIHQYYLRGM